MKLKMNYITITDGRQGGMRARGQVGKMARGQDGVMGGQEWRHEGEESKINLTVKIYFDSVDFIIKLVNQGWKQFGFYRRGSWGE